MVDLAERQCEIMRTADASSPASCAHLGAAELVVVVVVVVVGGGGCSFPTSHLEHPGSEWEEGHLRHGGALHYR